MVLIFDFPDKSPQSLLSSWSQDWQGFGLWHHHRGLGSVFGDFGRRTLGFESSLGGVFALAGLPVAWYLLVQIDDLPSHCEQLAVGVSASSADSSSPRAEVQLC